MVYQAMAETVAMADVARPVRAVASMSHRQLLSCATPRSLSTGYSPVGWLARAAQAVTAATPPAPAPRYSTGGTGGNGGNAGDGTSGGKGNPANGRTGGAGGPGGPAGPPLSGQGGGVFNAQAATKAVSVVSTIIAMNAAGTAASGPDIFGLFVDGGTGPSLGHNLIGDGTGGTGLTSGVNNDQVGGNGHPVIDPLFATTTPANNGGPTQTLALLSSSPALSKGSNPDSLPYDQRGPGYAPHDWRLDRHRSISGGRDGGWAEPRSTPPWRGYHKQYVLRPATIRRLAQFLARPHRFLGRPLHHPGVARRTKRKIVTAQVDNFRMSM